MAFKTKRRLLKYIPKRKNGKSYIRYIPFYSKGMNPVWYYLVYLFNKIFEVDIKPIPFSNKLVEHNKKINKIFIKGIMPELRYLTLIIINIFVVFYIAIAFEHAESVFDKILVIQMILVGGMIFLITKLIIHFIRTGQIHQCDPGGPTVYDELQKPTEDKPKRKYTKRIPKKLGASDESNETNSNGH